MTASVDDDLGRSDSEHPLLAVLADLKQSPVGTVIYDQIHRILLDQEAAQLGIERAYTMLLRVLLDAYARSPTLEQVNQLNGKMIELRRLTPPLPAASLSGTRPAAVERPARPTASPPAASEELSLNQVLEQLLHGQGMPVADDKPQAPLERESAEVQAARPPRTVEGTPAPAAPASPPEGGVEVASAYRLHLDRKRDEIAKLQSAFTQNVTDAITQNREFGALLQIELNALQQADGAQEIEQLRQILIGGIEELIQGQRALAAKLHRTSDFLALIKSDSDRLREELNKVRLLSLTDEFTGLPNRRAFMRRLQDEIGRAQRYGSPLALALLDLDEFKAVNDVHGHAAGDEVLRCYAANVLSILRHHDLVARYGGEEFAVLLPNTVLQGAVAALHKVKGRAQSVACSFDGKSLKIPSFSAGVTMYAPGDLYTTLVDRADRALYRAKRLGRNRVEVELAPEAAIAAAAPGHDA